MDGLACAAASGDRQAMFELGVRHEFGIGMEADAREAARLYRRAGTPTRGTMFVYSPAVGRETSGQVIPVRTGPVEPGLPEAQYRLALLYLRGDGVKQSPKDARRWLQAAAAGGHRPSIALLAVVSPP